MERVSFKKKRPDPARLAEQMEVAADLHQEYFWSKLMKDGATVIRELIEARDNP